MKKIIGLLVVLSVVLTASTALAAPKKPSKGGNITETQGAICDMLW